MDFHGSALRDDFPMIEALEGMARLDLIRKSDGDDGQDPERVVDAEDVSHVILGGRFGVLSPVSDLDPAAPQAQAFGGQVHDNRGDGTILNPYVGYGFIAADHHRKRSVFQEGGSAFLAAGQPRDNLGILHEEKFPWSVSP